MNITWSTPEEETNIMHYYAMYFRAKKMNLDILTFIFNHSYNMDYETTGERFIRAYYLDYGVDVSNRSMLKIAYKLRDLELLKTHITKPVEKFVAQKHIYPFFILYNAIKSFYDNNTKIRININARDDDFNF